MTHRLDHEHVVGAQRLHLTPIREGGNAQLHDPLQQVSRIERRSEHLAHVRKKPLTLFGAFVLVDIGGRREQANDGTVLDPQRNGALQEPTVLSRLRAQARFERKIAAVPRGGLPPCEDGIAVVGVKGRKPPVVLERLSLVEPRKLEPPPIEVINLSVRTGSADNLWNGVGEHAQRALVFHQRLARAQSGYDDPGSSTNGFTEPAAMMYQAVAPTCSEAKYLSPSQSRKPFFDAATIPRPSLFGPFVWAYATSLR